MEVLLLFPGFILAIIIVVIYEYKIHSNSLKIGKNKVHFYIARDKNGELVLWLNKPYRGIDHWINMGECMVMGTGDELYMFYGLNTEDFKNLKWEDEPLEVFLN